MKTPGVIRSIALPLAVVAVMIVIWTLVWRSGVFHPSAFPAPLDVVRGFGEEARTGRLFTDLIT
jgi:ABC-type nitrate/sulfonate/bicarbonate transport system permease component